MARIYESLVFSLSVGDLVLSCAYVALCTAVPQGTPGCYWALGNVSTCTAAGLFTLLGVLSVAAMNCSLAVYFLLVIRRGWRADDFMQRRGMLGAFYICFAVVLPLIICILAVALKGFNFSTASNFCSLADNPDGCRLNDKVPCERGEQTTMLLGLSFIFLGTCCITGIGCTFAVYWTVRSRLHPSRGRLSTECNSSGKRANRLDISNSRYDSTTADTNMTEAQKGRLRQTSWQAVFYCLAYVNVIVWPVIAGISRPLNHTGNAYEFKSETWMLIRLFFMYTFFPLQGFLNAIIFVRPDVLRWRKLHPEQNSLGRAIWEIVVAKKDSKSQSGRRSTQVQEPQQPECSQNDNPGPPTSRSKQDLTNESTGPQEIATRESGST